MPGRRKVVEEDYDSVSHFILCVKKRPPLYNFKLSSEMRKRVDVARMWEELAKEVGNLTAAECRIKWKNLRDTYRQYRLHKPEKWLYYADMSFLTDIYQNNLKSDCANRSNSTDEESIGMYESELEFSDASDGSWKMVENVETEAVCSDTHAEEDTSIPASDNTVEDKMEEMDLFFDLLKNKVRNLPSGDIAEIQIELLNTVLRREAANSMKRGAKNNTLF